MGYIYICTIRYRQESCKCDELWQPFVFEYEGQLIQGIIDLCFEEDGELVIVDYKTDRVMKGKAGEKELVKRYAIQLDYYAKALEQLTGKTVKEKIVYSFTLGKEIMC